MFVIRVLRFVLHVLLDRTMLCSIVSSKQCLFSGLDSSILPYLQLFLNNQVNGQQLLNVRSEDLDNIGVKRLGHQELILEAVEHLRNFVSYSTRFTFEKS